MSIELQTIDKLKEAYNIMKAAACQSHSGHWDREGTHGLNCYECQRANNLTIKAEVIFNGALELLDRANKT